MNPATRHAYRTFTRWTERVVFTLLAAAASISILTTVGIVGVLVFETFEFFQEVSLWEFFTGTRWSPLIQPNHFGILPLIAGTLWVTVGAGLFAIPVGLLSAVYLSEYASHRMRTLIKPVLEVLAGIPSVVYGYLAVVVVSPILMKVMPIVFSAIVTAAGWIGLQWVAPEVDVLNAVNASVVVGIMILPTVASLSEDVLRSVPRALREAAYALGSNKFDVTVRVVVPAGLSGIMASFLLGLSRAIGETMAVSLAAGSTPVLTMNPFQSMQTMTAYIVQVSQGDTPAGTIEYRTIFAVGSTLFLMTLVMNILARWILSRYREAYE